MRRPRRALLRVAWGGTLLLLPTAAAAAQGAASPGAASRGAVPRPAADSVTPRIVPIRLAERPVIDGHLRERMWDAPPSASQFTEVEPRDGVPAQQGTAVWVATDADAVYIAARLSDANPQQILGRLGRRDSDTGSDIFIVALDSYHDHRTAFRFAVNPAGVKSDDITSNDQQGGDGSWDPVWDVATAIDSAGWTLEMRIPVSQLRTSASLTTWGINFERFTGRTGAFDRWRWAPRAEAGYASRFGHLDGMRIGGGATHRVELMPYLVGQHDRDSGAPRPNPLHLDQSSRVTAGVDLKVRLTQGLTLTGTVNPDFGQVEADPAELNIGIYETYFQERRPFFVEGANLFAFGAGSSGTAFGAPALFYSRRIGKPPSASASGGAAFARAPEVARIQGAGKLSGQAGAWSLGVLAATTLREDAEVVRSDGTRSTVEVEPRAAVAVASLRRDFRGGNSGIGLMGTFLSRHIDTTSLAFLRRSALTGGLDLFHRFRRNQFSVSGTVSGSRIDGDSLAILLAQRASSRYYQRPDQDYARLDPSARSLSGYAASLSGGKTAGRWLLQTDLLANSPGFEINDAGFQQDADRLFHGLRVTRRWPRPSAVFRYAQANLTASQQWNFGGVRVNRSAALSGFGQFRNFWSATLGTTLSAPSLNDKVTRGGPLLLVPSQWSVNGSMTSDSRRPYTIGASGTITRNRSGGSLDFVQLQGGVRPTSALNVSVQGSYSHNHSEGGYIGTGADSTASATFGRRYLLADLDQRIAQITLRTDVALTPTMSLQVYAQPFASAVDFGSYKALARPRAFAFLEYGADGVSTLRHDAASRRYFVDADGSGPAPELVFRDPDLRVRALRANVVARWEFRPGSTLFITWAHGRNTAFDDARFDAFADFGALPQDEQRNRVLVKLTYWFNP